MDQREELLERKRQAMRLMADGLPWQEANEQSGLGYSKSGILGLYRKWRKDGDGVLIDQRHGHVHKATAEVQDWMMERSTEESDVPASQLIVEMEAQFGVTLTPQYVNILRHQLGLPVPRPGRPGPGQGAEPALGQDPAAETEPERDFSPSGG